MKNNSKKIKLFIVVNVDWFFLSHRRQIAVAALKAGYDVTIIAKDTGCRKQIEEYGLRFINLPMDRNNGKPLQDYAAIQFLYKLFRQVKPDIVHNVGLKVVILSGIAALLAHVKSVVSALSGLGITFSPERDNSMTTKVLVRIMKYVHSGHDIMAIFQNSDDMNIFENKNIINPPHSVKIRGSGVDLRKFAYSEDPISSRIKIILTARMIVDKGILVLAEAAKIMRDEYNTKIQFILCGGLDDNPKALSKKTLESIEDGEYIKWLGHRTDIVQLLQSSNIVVLPSFYKEGLPKSLIEAAAMGRPIVTTDSVGCRDAVVDGKSGFLVPINNPEILADKLKLLIDNREMRVAFGINARFLAESTFSIENVINSHLEIYRNLSGQ